MQFIKRLEAVSAFDEEIEAAHLLVDNGAERIPAVLTTERAAELHAVIDGLYLPNQTDKTVHFEASHNPMEGVPFIPDVMLSAAEQVVMLNQGGTL